MFHIHLVLDFEKIIILQGTLLKVAFLPVGYQIFPKLDSIPHSKFLTPFHLFIILRFPPLIFQFLKINRNTL